ncbi:MAG: hypothetical protein J6A09_04970, partial [Alphaproteobacteria bacterium]|nr:hypothetical protein [Alphaproteobacteria bacterium]
MKKIFICAALFLFSGLCYASPLTMSQFYEMHQQTKDVSRPDERVVYYIAGIEDTLNAKYITLYKERIESLPEKERLEKINLCMNNRAVLIGLLNDLYIENIDTWKDKYIISVLEALKEY